MQRLDDFVDEEGYRGLRRVAACDVVLRATWGTKRGEVSVAVLDGVTGSVTLVLK